VLGVAGLGLVVVSAQPAQLSGGPASSSFINTSIKKNGELQAPEEVYGAGGGLKTRLVESASDVGSTDLAAVVSEESNMIVSSSVVNYQETLITQATVAPIQADIIDKPQTTLEDESKRVIVEYASVEGDSVKLVAEKFGISEDTIRWANNIQGDAIVNGSKLRVLPITGVSVILKEGETLDKVTEKYGGNIEEVVIFNDIDLDAGVAVGTEVIIPNGVKPIEGGATARPRRSSNLVAGSTVGSVSVGSPSYGGNTYAKGYCTWWAANRRAQIGRAIPNRMGNAISWAPKARAYGYSVTGTPSAGDVLHHKSAGRGGYGHVAFVEKVNEDGSITISEMNYKGWNRVSYRTISPSEFGKYNFIH
jgi:surface antigen/transposase-like protein